MDGKSWSTHSAHTIIIEAYQYMYVREAGCPNVSVKKWSVHVIQFGLHCREGFRQLNQHPNCAGGFVTYTNSRYIDFWL